MEIINFILIIYLLTQINSLKKRRQEYNQKDMSYSPANPPPPEVKAPEQGPQISAIDYVDKKAESRSEDILSKGLSWVREDWMLKLGGLFILLAIGWFVTYAFMNNWIGEVGRILLGILVGCVFMTWGTLRMKNVLREGEVILIIGAIILVTSIFAGQHLYHLYPDMVALPAMTFVALVIAAISYINKREVLAVCGVLMIGISPILAGYDTVTPNIPGLLSYLLCMALGVLWLAKATGWKSVTLLTTMVVFAYVFPHFLRYYEYSQVGTRAMHMYGDISYIPQRLPVDIDVLRFFAIVFSILFNMSTFITLAFEKKISRDDFPLAVVSAGFVAFSIFTLATPNFLVFELILVAIVFMILAITLKKITTYSYYVELYATVSILFLIAATLKTAHMDLLPTILAVEAIVMSLFYRYAFGSPYPLVSILLYGGSFLLALGGISEVGRTWQSSISCMAALTSTYFPYFLTQYDSQDKTKKVNPTISTLSLVLGNILASLGFYNCIDNIGYREGIAQSIVKGIRYSAFALVGSFLYFASRNHEHRVKYYFSIGFIFYVVGSLLLYEVWMMDIAARIVTFFLIGLLFVSSIYFLKLYERK